MSKSELLNKIESYWIPLIYDGNLGFGIAMYTQNKHEEMFLTHRKTIKVFTSETELVEETLKKNGIKEYGAKLPIFLEYFPLSVVDLSQIAIPFSDDLSKRYKVKYSTEELVKEIVSYIGFKENE